MEKRKLRNNIFLAVTILLALGAVAMLALPLLRLLRPGQRRLIGPQAPPKRRPRLKAGLHLLHRIAPSRRLHLFRIVTCPPSLFSDESRIS